MWLFYGSNNFPADERPPIPYVPELDDPTWKPVYGEVMYFASTVKTDLHSVLQNDIICLHSAF